jgi:hypothetical protein
LPEIAAGQKADPQKIAEAGVAAALAAEEKKSV